MMNRMKQYHWCLFTEIWRQRVNFKKEQKWFIISIQPLPRRIFNCIYRLACTTHQCRLLFFTKSNFYEDEHILLQIWKLLKPRLVSQIHPIWTCITLTLHQYLAQRWLFHHQHVKCSSLFYLVPHPNRCHFDGMSRNFRIFVCSFPLSSPLFSPPLLLV